MVEVPEAFLEKLQRIGMHEVRVIVLIGEPTKVHYEEEAWARLTTEQFLAKVIGGTAIGDTTQENLSKVKEKIQQIFASI